MKTAIAYSIILTSFDNDYYYGQLVRNWSDDNKAITSEFLSNCYVDLDDDNSVGRVYLEPIGFKPIHSQVLTDFEVLSKYDLEIKLFESIEPKRRDIFQSLKVNGKCFETPVLR